MIAAVAVAAAVSSVSVTVVVRGQSTADNDKQKKALLNAVNLAKDSKWLALLAHVETSGLAEPARCRFKATAEYRLLRMDEAPATELKCIRIARKFGKKAETDAKGWLLGERMIAWSNVCGSATCDGQCKKECKKEYRRECKREYKKECKRGCKKVSNREFRRV